MASSLAVPSPDVVRHATDKWVLAELAAGAGLQSPPTTVVERAEIAARASDLPTPAVIKPLRSKVAAAGGSPRGDGRRVESPSELRARRCRASARSSSRTCRSARIDRRRGMAGGTGLREPQCAHILPPVCGVSAYAETIPRDRAAGGANREIAAVYRLERDLPGAVHSLRRQALPHRLEPPDRRIAGTSGRCRAESSRDLGGSALGTAARPSTAIASGQVPLRGEGRRRASRCLCPQTVPRGLGGLIPRRRTVHATLARGLPVVRSLTKVGGLQSAACPGRGQLPC